MILAQLYGGSEEWKDLFEKFPSVGFVRLQTFYCCELIATHQGVLHECVSVTYRAPSSYMSLRTANRFSREWPPSTAIKLAIRPLLKASHMSESKGVWQSLCNMGAPTISSRHDLGQEFW